MYGGSSYHNDDHSDHNDAQGDSGGALLAQDRELLGWSAVGIVSYQPGIECGTENYVVFTEIRYEDQDPELDTTLIISGNICRGSRPSTASCRPGNKWMENNIDVKLRLGTTAMIQ